jgi:rhamnogalacturonyl hydrolase YesR
VKKEILQKVCDAMLSMQRLPWEQGVAAQACFAMNDKELGTLLAHEAVHRQLRDGRLANIDYMNPCTDAGVNGESVLDAYEYTKDEIFKQAADKMVEWFISKTPKSEDGIIYFELHKQDIIADAPYMICPFLAKAGQFAEAFKQIEGHRRYLQDPKTKLFHELYSDDRKVISAPVLWGGGNGWFAGGMAKTHAYLPASMKREKDLISAWLKEHVDAWLTYQLPDGLFNDKINEPDSFVETNSSYMLSYAIYCAVKGGSLSKEYIVPAHKMRLAANKRIDDNGIVTMVAGAPFFQMPGVSTEGQAFCILSNCAAEEFE